ncbi:growth factor receptor-bound protein 7 isoform 4-T4 [Theristicus caerulescens]
MWSPSRRPVGAAHTWPQTPGPAAPGPRTRSLVRCRTRSLPPDNAMDGGAQQSSLREPPGPGGAEQEGVPGEWDGGEGPPEVKRSQPLFIHGSSRQLPEEEPRASSLPSIPNPFPELCSPSNSPILSSPALGQGPPREGASHVVKVFGEDGACRSLEASAGTTARQLCETLVRRTRALQDHSWALVELHQHLALERCLEDHESVVEVQSSWPPGADSRFVFRKNFAKYELFKSNTQSLFPEVMVSSCLEANKSMAHSELIQNFLNSGSCPEVQGFLHLRETRRKVWKRFYFSLRRSGLYYSTKGTSKDPRHLQYFADLTESNIYYVTQGKKHYGTPTEFSFCIKPYKVRSGVKGLKLLCSEDEQSRSCWMAAFRLFKYGMQLYRNYQQAQARLSQPPWIGPTPLRSVSDNALVAMDFSGCTGRVIENPSEVLTVALEEAQAWRKKTTHRYSLPAACQSSPLSAAIHCTQPWFHGRISREDTQQLIGRQGLVDGAKRKDGSTSPWTTGRPVSPTSSSSWSFTRSTAASCPASCGTTAPAWLSEPGTTGTVWHGRHSRAWLSLAPPAWHGLAQPSTTGKAWHSLAPLARLGTTQHHQHGMVWHSLALLARVGTALHGAAGLGPARRSKHRVEDGSSTASRLPCAPGAGSACGVPGCRRCRAPPHSSTFSPRSAGPEGPRGSPRDPGTPHPWARRIGGPQPQERGPGEVGGAPTTASPRGQSNCDVFYTIENKGYFFRVPASPSLKEKLGSWGGCPSPQPPAAGGHMAGSVPVSRRVPAVPRVLHKGPSVHPGHHVRLSHAAAGKS